MSVGTDFLTAICDRSLTGEIRKIERDYFNEGAERDFYDLCIGHLRTYGALPSEDTITDQLAIELDRCEDTVEYYLDALRERQLHNELVGPFNSLRTALSERDTTNARQAVDMLSSVSRTRSDATDFLSMGEVGDLVIERYNRNHRIDGLIGIPTGFPSLDAESSGMQPGDLNMLVARPSVGKTWLMLHMLKTAIDAGALVLFVTMEMPMLQIGTRYISYDAGVNPTHARMGMLGYYDQQRFFASAEKYKQLLGNQLYVYQGSMRHGTAGVDALVAERRPDIVFTDGVYLLRSAMTRSGASENIVVQDALRDLKDMAVIRDIPVVGSSKLNRDGAGGNMTMETLGITDSFGTDCSIIYGVQKPHKSAEDERTRLVKTIKGREGEEATIAINYKFGPVRFNEVPMSLAVKQTEQTQPESSLEWRRPDDSADD